jgi:gluconolactonase
MSGAFERVAGPFGGPAAGVVWTGAHILFSLFSEGQILQFDSVSGSVEPLRRFTNRTSGLALGPEGRLFGCQEGSRRIIEFRSDGSALPIVALLDGRRHNYPRDLTVDSAGRIWFADPYSATLSHGPQLFPALPHASILRLNRDPVTHDWMVARITRDTTSPRALLLSADETTLYVGDGDLAGDGARELRAYPIGEDGNLGLGTLLHSFGSDHRGPQRGVEGLCLDVEGNVLACAGAPDVGPGSLIYVFSPTGRVLETYALPEDLPVRCVFGGAHLDDLYVTGESGSLWRCKSIGRKGFQRRFAAHP